MRTLKLIQKINDAGEPIKHGETLIINIEKLIGFETKSLYIRKGFKNGTLFLSQKGSGGNGAGDICKIREDSTIEVNFKLFDRIKILATKANAIINS